MIVKVGVLILFLGMAFLLRYAAENDMLPLELRYAAVAAGGFALLSAGWHWRAREDHYGLVLQGAGTAVLYLTTLAAIKTHALIPVVPGFAILVGVAALAACRHRFTSYSADRDPDNRTSAGSPLAVATTR